MNCGSCIRFKVFDTGSQLSLGHCKLKAKNVVVSDVACENYVDDEILDIYEQLFINRRDTYAIQQEDGTYRRVEGWLTKRVLKSHLAGEITVGAYQIKPKTNTVKWIVFDIDPKHIKQPEADLLDIYHACLENNRIPMKTILLEASRNPDPSFHVWIFFEPEFPTPAARWLAKTILEKAGVACEVFPKQNHVKEREFGNLMKLPLGFHQEEKKWSRFLNPETLQPLKPELLTKIQGLSLSEKDTKRMLELAQTPRRDVQTKLKTEKPYKGKDPPCIQELAQGVEKGQRNETGIRLVSYWLNFRKNKEATVWKKFREWNVKNQERLGEQELQSIFKSASDKEYVFGCDDDFLKQFCTGKSECSLGQSSMSPLELVEAELEKQKATCLHPLIDYHAETGLTIGTLLGNSSQALILMTEKAFTADFETPLLKETFANSISVSKPKWARLTPIHRKQILLLAGNYFSKKQIDFLSKKQVFQKTFEKMSHYYWHSEQSWIVTATCWVLATYFHPVFTFFPALCLQGERASGKTTLLEVLRKVAWNPTGREVALREADLFRTIQDSRVTYIADITRLNPRSNAYQDVVDVFETGTEQGGCVRRIKQDTGEPITYLTFGPKAVATRYELPFVPKTIRIITEKVKDPVYSKRRANIEFDEEFSEVVSCLVRATVKYWPEVVESYRAIEQTEKLKGRPFNYWSPLLAVCRVFAPERYDSLLGLAEEEAERMEKGDRLSDVEECVLTILLEIRGEATKSMLLKKLTEKAQNRVPWIKDWHIVKSAVTNLGITKRRYTTGGGVAYEFDLERVRKKAEARNLAVEEVPPEAPTKYGKCEVCGKPAAPCYFRDNREVCVHDECRDDYQGDL